MRCYNLTAIKGGGKSARFYIDGVRVSREKFEHVETMARMNGHLECFHTKAIPLPGGKTRRWNYSTARY